MGAARSSKQLRMAELDRILREEPERKRTTDAIRQQISQKVSPGPNKPDWAVRTLRYDVEEMKAWGAPITATHYTDALGINHDIYAYYDPNYIWPDLNLDSADLQSLQLAIAILEPYGALPAIQHLRDTASRLAGFINGKGKPLPALPLYFSQVKQLAVKPEVWEPVLQATQGKRELHIRYAGGWQQGEATYESTVHPLALVQLENDWYVMTVRPDGKYRQLRMDRMQSARVGKKHFKVPKDFDMQDLLDHTFQRFIGSPDDRVTVRLRFTEKLAPLIRSDRVHPKQDIRDEHDGTVTLSFDVSSGGPYPLLHVEQWVRGFGDDVEVLEPEDLKKLVQHGRPSPEA